MNRISKKAVILSERSEPKDLRLILQLHIIETESTVRMVP
jgi:hypothetical protein